MAKVNFNNLDEVEQSTSNNGPGSDVGFFTLKNDNDEAIVRFVCDSTDDFEILTVHDVQIGQRYKKVNCIRDPREPLDNCPLCKSGAKISNRFFIKMIQYNKVPDPATGVTRVVPQAMIWERSTAYAKTLKSYLDNYGPLTDIICKIIRHGKAGDMQTTYEIVPNLSKTVYPDDVYVKATDLFGDFQAFGTIVMDRNFDEMNHFLVNGEFPARVNNQSQQQAIPQEQAQYQRPSMEVPSSAAPVTVPNMPGIDNTGMTYPSNPAVNPSSAPAASQYGGYPTPSQPGNGSNGFGGPQQYNNFGANTAQSGFDRPRRY